VDSLLVSYRGKLLLEAYYRRGRANYPHYQMSITKSYTALALGRAIQLGHLKIEDLDKPVISFLKELDAAKLAPGADGITLAQAMGMLSGIRVDEAKLKELRRKPAQLQGQGEIQAYLENSAPIPPPPREFKYQETDPAMAMQALWDRRSGLYALADVTVNVETIDSQQLIDSVAALAHDGTLGIG
jgi:CubicO group peptidase (beta-lactamase class C family)